MDEKKQNKLSSKPKLLTKIHYWSKQHGTLVYIIVGIVLISLALFIAVFIYNQQKQTESTPTVNIDKKPPPIYYSNLTGIKVDNETATSQAVTAIMIENSPDARPQSGLKQSGVVFEAIAEGGITRFLTLHQQDKPQIIGPVRSLRMYYVDWLAPFNASIAHVGGSAASLNEVRSGNYRDIDQFFYPDYYWRSIDRYAPHNVYTSFEKLDKLNTSKGYTSSNFTGFNRTDAMPTETPTASSIAINISGPLYNTSYTYDKTNNNYIRSQAGVAHIDREDGQITPNVVIAMKVNMSLVMEDGYREDITTIGSGSAFIFQNGGAQEVKWNKKDRFSQITFTDSEGNNVPLVRGQTWISAVPSQTGSVTWE